MWTSYDVLEELYKFFDDHQSADQERFKRWLQMLKRRPTDEAFDALFGAFCQTN